MIHLQDIHFGYSDAGAPAVISGVSLEVADGEFIALLGPNGSGKTTLLRLISGVLTPQQGTVSLRGRAVSACTRRELAQLIAVVPQRFELVFPYRVAELVLMGRAPYQTALSFDTERDREIAAYAMEQTEVTQLRDRYISGLSGGELQRVIIARALAQQPAILLLDEPTAFLDLRHQVQLYRLLERLHTEHELTIMVVSHDINLSARFCQRLVLLSDGQVACHGTPEEVLRPEIINRIYQIQSTIIPHPHTGKPFCLIE